jgi:hypothetical protein
MTLEEFFLRFAYASVVSTIKFAWKDLDERENRRDSGCPASLILADGEIIVVYVSSSAYVFMFGRNTPDVLKKR